MTQEQNTAPAEGNADTPATHNIGLADLQMAVKIIDHAAEQGAFKGWATIQQVFAVRTKINNFVVASLPPEEVAPAEPVTTPKEVKTANRVVKSPAGAKASAAAKPVTKKTPAKK